MREAGTALLVVSMLLLVTLALAQGYVGLPLMRRSRRAGDPPIFSLRLRRHVKASDRVPDWVPFALLAAGGVGLLLSLYG